MGIREDKGQKNSIPKKQWGKDQIPNLIGVYLLDIFAKQHDRSGQKGEEGEKAVDILNQGFDTCTLRGTDLTVNGVTFSLAGKKIPLLAFILGTAKRYAQRPA
jgi:hypothetical protein